jgi:hypothetical protein
MYFYDLKSGLTTKYGNLFSVYVMNTLNCNKIDCKFSFACLVIFITKYGVISAIESAHTNKKWNCSLEAKKIKLEGCFFVKCF